MSKWSSIAFAYTNKEGACFDKIPRLLQKRFSSGLDWFQAYEALDTLDNLETIDSLEDFFCHSLVRKNVKTATINLI